MPMNFAMKFVMKSVDEVCRWENFIFTTSMVPLSSLPPLKRYFPKYIIYYVANYTIVLYI